MSVLFTVGSPAGTPRGGKASSMNILRFSVPGNAAEAVNVRQLETCGRKAGVSVVQFGYRFAYRDSVDGNAYRCRITCSAQMAVFFIEQLRATGADAMDRGETLTAAACDRAIRETYAALMAPRTPRRRSQAPKSDSSRIGRRHAAPKVSEP